MNDDGTGSISDDEGRDEHRDDWRQDVPDSERIGNDRSRISDEEWDDLVQQIAEPAATMGEIPVEDVRDALAEEDRWHPEPAEPIGWRTASPTLVLSWVATLGAVALLLIGAIFFRPLPGWYLLIGIAVGIGGAVGLFYHLPSHRSADDGDGSSV